MLFPAFGWGQADVSPLAGYTPGQVLQGGPAGSIALSGIEVFNPANNQISINIPLVTVHGRGPVSVPLLVPLTNPVWETIAAQYQYNCGEYGCSTGYGYIVQTTGWNPFPATVGQGGNMVMRGSGDYCSSGSWHATLTRGTFTAPDGTQTEFIDQATNGAPENPGYNRGTAFIADNGSGARFSASSAVADPTYCNSFSSAPSGTMTLSNGTVYTFVSGAVTQIEDSNGNITTFNSNSVTDSLGRTYTISAVSDNGDNYDQITYSGYGGAARTIKVHYDTLYHCLVSGQSIETYGQLWPGIPGPPTSNGPSNLNSPFNPNDMVTEIDLPDGSKYTFLYDAYGDVAVINLPTGGQIQYSYSMSTSSVGSTPAVTYMMAAVPTTRSQYSVSGGTQTLVSQMKFPTLGEIDRYDGNNNLLSKETHAIVNGGTLPTYATNYNSWQYNQSSANTYYDSAANGGGVLESQAISYFQASNCTVNCGTAQTVTTTMGSSVKQASYAYDQYGNVTDEYDYDWNNNTPGSLLRHVNTSYVTDSAYTGTPNLISLPSEVKIYDGGGNLGSDTKYTYDSGSMANCAYVTGHDNSNYAGQGVRGNVASISQLASGSLWLTTSLGYDITGNLVSASDPKSNTTNYNFADNYSDGTGRNSCGFATSVTNALSQTATIQYDYNTGKPTIATDPNGAQTQYTYSDSLERLTKVQYADGGTMTYTYSSPTTIIQQQDETNAGDGLIKTQRLLDEFGRLIETDSYNNSGQAIAVTQSYDALGRVSQTTNPSISGDNLNYATTYSYDGLNRLTQTTPPDGSVTTTSYSGNSSWTTDPAGIARRTWVDGLGRVNEVEEDPNNLQYVTYYGYNGLGKLSSVSQGSQSRSYSYDLLGRMTQAVNPESGTVNFTYDNASNLQTKTDNRGITTTYNYDALNRPTGITYSDGTSSATFGYDAGGAAAHAIGQLTSISNGNSITSFTNFDAVGRVTASQQQTGSVTYPAFYYWYNLAGELTKEQYPSGRTVSTSYDSAGRVSGITGLLGSTSTTYLSNISYWPHGAVYQQKYGNNLWRSYTFNSRLQVNQQWDAIYNAPSYFLSFEIYNWGTSNNNGNLQSRNEYFGGPTTFGSLQEITQNYSYDTLSRVQYFSEASSGSQGVCGGTCSYRYYGYDRWGNQWITANGGLPNPALATTTNNYNPATNYRYDEAYDGAGNQTSVDGDNATYDAENRLRLLVNPMTGAMETFLYDGAGRRVQKSYSSHTTNYVYDALGFLAAEYSASAVSKEYIPFGSQVIAVENASGSPCQTCYLNYDHLGSVRLVTDENAAVVARHDYVPYGEEIFPPYAGRTAPFGNTDYVNPRFTGQMRDTENLLDYFNARYFGPGLGRFVSPDPMNAGADVGNPQSWNGYLYGLGNPVVYTDPSGMFGEKPPAAPVSPTQLCTILITGGENLLQPADPCLPSVASTYGAPSGSGATGSSSSGSPSASPAKTGTCPSVPAGPGKNVLISNINLAEQASQIFDAQPNGNLMKIRWYYDNVRTGAPMDYKNQPKVGAHKAWDEFGQFNFGAVGAALSLPEEFIKQAAGIASFASFLRQGKLPPSNFGLPWTGPPYGDQPWAQPQISAGYRFTFVYHQGGC